LKVRDHAEPDEELTADFGFRSFGIDPGGFTLNGRRFFLRAVRDDLLFPGRGRTVPSEEALEQRLKTIRELGFNTLYTAGIPPDARLPRCADRLGLLLWYEMPFFSRFSSIAAQRFMRLFHGILQRDRRHPSFVMITMFGGRLPAPEAEVKEWAGREKLCERSGDPVVVPGPQASCLEHLNPVRFVQPFRGQDGPGLHEDGRPAVAWPVVSRSLPEITTGREGVQFLGNLQGVRKDLESAQCEEILSQIAEARGRQGVHGYLVRRLFDTPGERTGICRGERTCREAGRRLGSLQRSEDWIGATAGNAVAVSGEEATKNVVDKS
jgi:hypothetical protein